MPHLLSELQQIKADARTLKMSSIYDDIDSMLEDATLQKWSPERFLCQVLRKEVTNRYKIRKMLRVKQASFPQKLYLNDLVRSELPEDGRVALPVLEALDFIKEGRNIVLYGNPGTGKTHIATGLGILVCSACSTAYGARALMESIDILIIAQVVRFDVLQ